MDYWSVPHWPERAEQLLLNYEKIHAGIWAFNGIDDLHYDRAVPYFKGGSSLTAKNIRLLCARHSLAKSNKIE